MEQHSAYSDFFWVLYPVMFWCCYNSTQFHPPRHLVYRLCTYTGPTEYQRSCSPEVLLSELKNLARAHHKHFSVVCFTICSINILLSFTLLCYLSTVSCLQSVQHPCGLWAPYSCSQSVWHACSQSVWCACSQSVQCSVLCLVHCSRLPLFTGCAVSSLYTLCRLYNTLPLIAEAINPYSSHTSFVCGVDLVIYFPLSHCRTHITVSGSMVLFLL